ncbi:amidase family protein [Streptomyces antibioticus]|uniref:amidase family protein n=1 Tax=Streptomyces antibioticus TaxID=1890 RepID=UPI003D740605
MLAERRHPRETWHRFFADAGPDLIVTRAAPTPAIRAGRRSLLGDGAERGFFDQTAWTTFTSHTGLPSLIAPVAHDPNGLPIGVQLTARHPRTGSCRPSRRNRRSSRHSAGRREQNLPRPRERGASAHPEADRQRQFKDPVRRREIRKQLP